MVVHSPAHVPNRRNFHQKNPAYDDAHALLPVHGQDPGYDDALVHEHDRDEHARGHALFHAFAHVNSNRVLFRADDLLTLRVPYVFSSMAHIKNPVVTLESRGKNPVFAI